VLDGNEGRVYDGIANLVMFSSDSRRFAFRARRGRDSFVVVDGEEWKPFQKIETMKFSPDGRRFGFCAATGPGHRVVVDREMIGPEYRWIIANQFDFSPDGEHVAYAAIGHDDRARMVVDGSEIDAPAIQQHGEGGILFSPNSKRMAYCCITLGNYSFVVVDGRAERTFFGVVRGSYVFSPDSKHLAYDVAIDERSEAVVLDGEVLASFQEVWEGTLSFSPDSRYLAYWAYRDGAWRIVVNREETKEYDGFINGTAIVFDSPTVLHTLARQGADYMRVKVEIV
jgi:hypothetical protein